MACCHIVKNKQVESFFFFFIMESGETLVAVLAIICAIGLPVVMTIFICYWVLVGKHKERMAMIERGIVPEEALRTKANPNRYIALRNGMLMASLAIGALIGILIESCFTFTNEWHWLLVPMITVLFGGIGFVGYFFLSHHLEQKEAKENLPQALND